MKLNVAIVQTDIFWEDVTKNLTHFGILIDSISSDVDLIVLPEMFNTGFTMNPASVAESSAGPTILWLREKSLNKQAHIIGSMAFIDENGKFYNRLIWMKPDGDWLFYDKRHLFTLSGENEVYEAGSEKLLVDIKGVRVCPFICYDLRFPVWSRNVDEYDLLIYIASWPKPRIEAWKSLLCARAIENQSFTIGVNRIGKDGNDYVYIGESSVFQFDGQKILSAGNRDTVQTITLDFSAQKKYREKLNFLGDKDEFSIKK